MPSSTLNLKNNFGEYTQNYQIGGSSQVSASFIVDSTNVNGLGISGLSGAAIGSIFMHTSATPLANNPNPAVGYIIVNLAKSYLGYTSLNYTLSPANSGTPINVTTGVTAGLVYVITALGTTNTAGWQALGVPAGQVPAVGMSFVAPATATTTGTGTIQVPKATGSGVYHLELVGDPALAAVTTAGGSQLILGAFAPTNSSTTTFVLAAPADGTRIYLRISMQDKILTP